MRIRHCVAVSFAAIVVGLVACGGNASSSCGSYFDSLVSYENKCDPGIQIDTSAKSTFQTYCGALAAAPGTNNFSGQLDTCVGLLNGATCGATINCKIAGTLGDGTACGVGVQCSGGRCDTSNATTIPNSEVTCGKCASYLAVGAQCGANGGLCDPGTSSCTNGTCVAFAQQGQSCAAANCAGGLTCDATKICQPQPTKGQACTGSCQAPYKCIQNTCADAVQSGGACPTGNECAGSLFCNPQTKTCQQVTTVGAGQPCGFIQNQIIGCQSGLTCQSGTTGQGTCVAPKQAGDACTVGQKQCADSPFLLCINGTCAVPDYSVCK
jgi:hypothetical protein